MNTYQDGFRAGLEAVRQRPHNAPRNPFDEDKDSAAHEGWEDGAIEAGICTDYTNGVLNE